MCDALKIISEVSRTDSTQSQLGINWEKPFVRRHDRFEGDGVSDHKNQFYFFVGNEVLNIFYLTIFSKKKKIWKKYNLHKFGNLEKLIKKFF